MEVVLDYDAFAYACYCGHHKPNTWGTSDILGQAAEEVTMLLTPRETMSLTDPTRDRGSSKSECGSI